MVLFTILIRGFVALIPKSKLTISKISFLTSLSIAVGVWAFIHLTRDWFAAPHEIHSELMSILEPANSTSQRMGHYLSVFFIALAALGLLIGIKLNLVQTPRKLSNLALRIQDTIERPSYILVSVLILTVFSWRWHGNVVPVAGALALIGLTAYILNKFGQRISRIIWLTLLLALGFFHIVLPILLPIDYSNTAFSKFVFLNEMHYSSVLGPAERLVQGGLLFDNVTVNYGLFFPVSISIFGDFNVSDYLRLQQFSNALFIIFSLLAYGRQAKWQTHVIFALGLFILPWTNNLPEWIAAPNQTGMRYIGISLAILFLAFNDKCSPNIRVILGGMLSALCLLLNFETGIIISVALMAFVFFTHNLQNWRNCLVKYSLFLFSIIVVIAVFWFMANQLLANPPKLDSFQASVKYLSLFLNGLGGVKLPVLSLGFIFLTHAGYYIILLVAKWNFRKLENTQAIRLVTSLMIVGWLAYYFNRPEPRNLWIIFVLYGFLILPLLHRRYISLSFKKIKKINIPIPILVIILFVVPQAVSANLSSLTRTYDYINHLMSAAPDTRAIYSGVILKKEIADALTRKAHYLIKLSTDKSIEYMTAFSFSLPIESGRSSFGLPQDAFIEILTKKDHELFLKNLQISGPDILLFDDYDAFRPQSLSHWESYYARIRRQIEPFYRLDGKSDGWYVYTRR
jgi:hypothetical protein